MSAEYYLITLANGQAITAADSRAPSKELFTSPQDLLNRAQHWRFDGNYIVSKIDGTVFDVYNELNVPHSPVGLWRKKVAPANIANQQFIFSPEGYLQAELNKACGLVLSVNGSSKLEIDTKTGAVNQIFRKIAAPPDVTTTFKNSTTAAATISWKHAGGETLVLTIPAGGSATYISARGSEFVAKDPSGKILEPTKIVADKDATITLQHHSDLPSGYFLLVLDNGLAVTASVSAPLTGQPKDLYNQRQYWRLEGTYLVSKVNPNKVIDLLSLKTEPGSPVGIWSRNGGFNQAWIVEPDGIYCRLTGPSLVMTITPNRDVVIGRKGDRPNQEFKAIEGLPDVKTTFVNKTNAVAKIYWLHYGETQVLAIPPGESAWYTLPKGSEFLAKDPSGAVLRPNKIVANQDATVTLQPGVIDGYFLLVLDNGLAVTASGGSELTGHPKDLLDQRQYWKLEGTYLVSKADPTRVIDLLNLNTEPGSPVGIWPRNGGINQAWTFGDDGIYCKLTGPDMVLTIEGCKKVVIGRRGDKPNQDFNLIPGLPDVKTTFENKTNAMAKIFWVHNGETPVLAVLPGGSAWYTSAKGAEFVAKDPSSTILKPPKIVANQDATITLLPASTALDGYFLLVLDNGLAVTASGGSALTGQPKDLLDQRQYWKMDGTYLVSKVQPTKVIDLFSQKTAPGSEVGIWEPNGGPHQAWTIGPEGIYCKRTGPDMVLTVDSCKNIVIGKKGDKPNQVFTPIAGLPDVKTTFSNKTNAVANVFWVHNGENKVLTIPAGGWDCYTSAKGCVFVAKDPHGAVLKPNKIVANEDATVTLQPAPDVLSEYFLLVLDNGLAVTASGGTALTGQPKDLLDQRQYWKLEGTYLVSKSDSTKVIDLLNLKTEPGSPVGIWPRNGGPNQAWTFGTTGIYCKLTGPDLVLTIDPNKNVVIGKKGDKPNQDFKPIVGLPDVTTIFENRSSALATIYWIHNGDHQILTIPAGGSAWYTSAQGAEFIAKAPNGSTLRPTKIVAYDDATVRLLPGSEAPGGPVLTYHSTSDLGVQLIWSAPSSGGAVVKSYTLVQVAPPGMPDITLSGDKLWYDFSGKGCTTYKYKVYATNTDNTRGADSNIVTFTVECPPPPPYVTHAQKNAKTVEISWSYPTDYPRAIKEWTLVFAEPLPSQTKTFPVNVRSFEITPSKNVEYEFYVIAENDQGVNSVRSNLDNFIVSEAGRPSPPTLSYKWLSVDRVHLEWTPDLLEGVTYTLTQTAPKTIVRDVGADLFYEMNLSLPGDYTFHVTAKNAAGSSDSVPITITVLDPSTVPQAPVLSYSRLDDKPTSLQLSWFVPKLNANAKAPIAKFSEAGGPIVASPAIFSSAGIKEFVVTQLTPEKKETVVVPSSNTFNVELPEDTRATFAVSARSLSGAPGPSSNPIQIFASSKSPSKPAITYSQTGNKVTVAWASDPNGGSPLKSYTLVQVAPTFQQLPPFSEPTHNYTFTPTSDVQYQFYVVAENTDGDQSPRSDTITFTIHSAVAPGAPVLSSTLSGSTANLTWTTPSNGGSPLQSYTLQQLSPTPTTYPVGLVNSYNVPLTPGQTYTFAVKATNSVPIDGPISNIVSITVPLPITRPGPPVLSLTPAGSGQIVLSWTAPRDNGSPITGYTLYQTSPSYKKFPITTATTQVIKVAAGQKYSFYVTATNKAGESAQSNVETYTAPKPTRWKLHGYTKYNNALNISIEWNLNISIVNGRAINLTPPEGRSWFRFIQNGSAQTTNYLDNASISLSGNHLTLRTAVSNNVLSGTLTDKNWSGSAQNVGADTSFNFTKTAF